MLQFEEFCRLCAQKKRNKCHLFSDSNSESSSILLAKIAICLSLKVSREDLLPKMVCFDCQKSVENFNLFRIKCHKAEEKLLKILCCNAPNRAAATDIKQEHSDIDFQESSNNLLELNPQVVQVPLPLDNIQSMGNVKCEVDEEANQIQNSQFNIEETDLIQILSNEIVNQQAMEDIKTPHIEVISQRLNDKFKTIDLLEIQNSETCEIKVIPEVLLQQNNHDWGDDREAASENTELLPINFVEIKEPLHDMDEEVIECKIPNSKTQKSKPFMSSLVTKSVLDKNLKRKKNSHKARNPLDIDEKFLTLAEGETCNIDIEEVEAVIKKKQDPSTRFQCQKCNKSFKFFKSWKRHKHWHESQPDIFICDICRKNQVATFEFSTLKSLNSHLQKKHMPSSELKFQCHLCHRTMSSRGELNAHSRKVHSSTDTSCRMCGKKFKNKIRLNCHLIVHREERPYICDQCGQSFKWSNALKVHMQWHKREKNFLCSECGKKFTAKKNLIEHLNIHAGKRPFTCDQCNATFVQLSAYSKHLYMHNEGRKTHKCDKCNKSYSHAYMLKQHLLRHTGLRPYECSTCHCAFKSQSDLWCHSKTHQEKQYGCKVCGRKFALSKTLRDHMVLHTGIKHICPVPGCGKTYTQRFSLTKHFSKQHPSLSIVSRKGGRKPPGTEGHSSDSDFIRYEFKEGK